MPSKTPAKPTTPAPKMNRLVSSLEGDGFLTPAYAGIDLVIYGVTAVKRIDRKTNEVQHGYLVDCEPVDGGDRVKLVTYAQVVCDTLTKANEDNLFPCVGRVGKPTGKNYYVFGE